MGCFRDISPFRGVNTLTHYIDESSITVFFIGYPGFLRYICKVQPNDERADELEQMEAIYGKLSDITKEINGDTERSLSFIQEESKLPNKIL